jgi:imidazolonepropionase-like amidohydrolase
MRLWIAALLVSLLPAGLAAQSPVGRMALRAARLIDGKSETVRRDAVVIVEGERIAAVGGPSS